MRAALPMTIALCAALLLVACQRKVTNADDTGTPDQTAAAPPAAAGPITDAAKKAALATLPAAYQSADLDNGQAMFAVCKSCHTVAQGGGAMIGPGLWGVFGRKAASQAGFSYSDSLKASKIVWDAASLDRWIANPRAVASDTKMTYAGMQEAKDRIDVVAYLKVATSPPAN